MKVEAFKQMLRYLYCQHLQLNSTLAQVIVAVAEFFLCQRALTAASVYLSENMGRPEHSVELIQRKECCVIYCPTEEPSDRGQKGVCREHHDLDRD